MPQQRDCGHAENAVPLQRDYDIKKLNEKKKSYEDNESNANASVLLL
jgi:hypothetical protein